MQNRSSSYDLFVRRWTWLFPLTFIFHILEEYYGGFAHWMMRITGSEIPPSQFLNLDILFWILMIAGIIMAVFVRSCSWLIVSFAVVVIINVLVHAVGSIVTASYSPGLATAVIFWMPLGIYTLFQAHKGLDKMQRNLGILTGIVLHMLIIVLILSAGGGPRW